MLLLVTDTSGRQGSIALARAGEGAKPDLNSVEVIESLCLEGGTFSAQLVPQMASLLSKHEFSKSDIGAFVVVSGPGSFTGLRVGLAAVKALAEILQKPIVPVSLLEIIAVASGVRGKVLAVLDAGRGEFYAGKYEVDGHAAQVIQEQLLSRDESLSLGDDCTIATPDENLAASLSSTEVSVLRVPAVDPEMIARRGWETLSAGNSVSPEQLEANYIRRTDAEIFAKPATRS